MLSPVDVNEGRRFIERFRCGECGGQLAIAWRGAPPPAWGKGEWIVRCGKNPNHFTIKRANRTRQLFDSERGWIEVDMTTQREVGIPGALAIPQTREAMLERANQTLQAGLWPKAMTPNQKALMVQVALAYGLDPLMGELVLYHGEPLITINARRRKDVEAGHHPSLKFRFLTAEEKQGYLDAGAINEGDLVQVGILTTEWGSTVEAIGKVTKAERSVSSERSRDPRGLAHPIVADNPIEMCQKRAEGRARLMAYGPIPLPQMPGMISDLATEGVTVEGEVMNHGELTGATLPVAPPPPENRNREPNIGREGRGLERDIDDLFPKEPESIQEAPPTDEGFDPNTSPPPPLPEHVTAMTHLEAVLKDQGWDVARLQTDVLHMPLEYYLRGHKVDEAYQLLKRLLENAG